MNSGTVVAGTDGWTTITFGAPAIVATGAISRIKSKLSFGVALIAFAAATKRSVYPSGGARTTVSVPILPPAPGRLSTMNDVPSRSDKNWLINRAAKSYPPPAGAGTIRRTGRDG